MSVTDPVILKFNPQYSQPWFLTRGRETFYDEERFMRLWPTAEAAVAWCRKELGVEAQDSGESVSAGRSRSGEDQVVRGSESGEGGQTEEQLSFLADSEAFWGGE